MIADAPSDLRANRAEAGVLAHGPFYPTSPGCALGSGASSRTAPSSA